MIVSCTTSSGEHCSPVVSQRWVELLCYSVTSLIRCPAEILLPFSINICVHQGLALSPVLFILCMDMVTVDLLMHHSLKLLYTVKVMLTKEALQLKAQEWKDLPGEQGMWPNIPKTEYLECGPWTDGTI